MLSIGWTEMLIVAAVALIVVGPRDLPVMLRQLGRLVGTVRRMGNEFRSEFNKMTALDEVRDVRKSLTEPLRNAKAEIEREFNKITPAGIVPSGKLKPFESDGESVVNAIKAQAGMPLDPPASPAATKSITGAIAKPSAKTGAKEAGAKKAAAKTAATRAKPAGKITSKAKAEKPTKVAAKASPDKAATVTAKSDIVKQAKSPARKSATAATAKAAPAKAATAKPSIAKAQAKVAASQPGRAGAAKKPARTRAKVEKA